MCLFLLYRKVNQLYIYIYPLFYRFFFHYRSLQSIFFLYVYPFYTMEYYSAIKKNTFESVLMRWMKLEPIIQCEVSHYRVLSRVPSAVLLLLLLLSRFSPVGLCATPQTAAHQAPLSTGFSRQEHWSGLPFPPPMHESEK